MKRLRIRRRMLVWLCDAGIIVFSMIAAFMLRFDFQLSADIQKLIEQGLMIALPIKGCVLFILRLDRGRWQYAGLSDLVRLGKGNLLASSLFTLAAVASIGPSFPRSVYILDCVICFLLAGGTRLAWRVYREVLVREVQKASKKGILIYGAAETGVALLRDIQRDPSLRHEVVGFVDDGNRNDAMLVADVPLLGSGRDILRLVERFRDRRPKIDEVIIAMPKASGHQMREALANCRAAGIPCKTVPSISELLSGKVRATQIRNVSVSDLLGREQVMLEEHRIRGLIEGRSILVTGAAGSIGSELCRQIGRFRPKLLILFDIAESELFNLREELRTLFPNHPVQLVIGDIRDVDTLDAVFGRYAPDTVFHAAAYKHVPLMEEQVLEAARNNILGTWNLTTVASRHNISTFLMISSDKAVNPTSVMGLTKRVAELIVSCVRTHMDISATRFVSVRFGNVLGSKGSVIPLFESQLAAGGPLTITHPDVRRFFMTVQEAVQLVLQAATMGKGAEIFVLDMGDPIRILDLAHNMIRLSGLEPGRDVEIRYVGLRPGEKLFEELGKAQEHTLPTYHNKIRIFGGHREESREMAAWIRQLRVLLEMRDDHGVIEHIKNLVPEYEPSSRWAQRPPSVQAKVAATY